MELANIKGLSVESLMLLSEIIDTMDIKEELQAINVTEKDEKKAQRELVKQFLILFVTRLHKVKQPIYEFIAEYKGVSIEEAKKIDIIAVLKDMFAVDGTTDFL